MVSTTKSSRKASSQQVSTAEAFYQLFCALPKKDRLLIARYILEDEDIQQSLEIPNEMTVQAFGEDKATMPVFSSIDALRKDLLA
jgi:hypothetical protein